MLPHPPRPGAGAPPHLVCAWATTPPYRPTRCCGWPSGIAETLEEAGAGPFLCLRSCPAAQLSMRLSVTLSVCHPPVAASKTLASAHHHQLHVNSDARHQQSAAHIDPSPLRLTSNHTPTQAQPLPPPHHDDPSLLPPPLPPPPLLPPLSLLPSSPHPHPSASPRRPPQQHPLLRHAPLVQHEGAVLGRLPRRRRHLYRAVVRHLPVLLLLLPPPLPPPLDPG